MKRSISPEQAPAASQTGAELPATEARAGIAGTASDRKPEQASQAQQGRASQELTEAQQIADQTSEQTQQERLRQHIAAQPGAKEVRWNRYMRLRQQAEQASQAQQARREQAVELHSDQATNVSSAIMVHDSDSDDHTAIIDHNALNTIIDDRAEVINVVSMPWPPRNRILQPEEVRVFVQNNPSLFERAV